MGRRGQSRTRTPSEVPGPHKSTLISRCQSFIFLIDWQVFLGCGGYGEAVAALVFFVAGVAFYPGEGDLVFVAQVEQLGPEVGVDGGIFRGAHPAVGAPFFRPAFAYSVGDVLRICVEGDCAGIAQAFQTDDGCGEFHAVVGCPAIAAGDLAALFAVL